MKTNNNMVPVLCLAGSVILISYCVAQATHKQGPPQPREWSVVKRPYNPQQEARDRKYEGLVELGDRMLGTNPAAAETYYRRATVVDPYPTDAWIGLARAADAQGKDSQALAAYRQTFDPPSGSGLYSSFPSDVESLARYGLLSEGAGQHEAAVKAYDQAAERLNPKPDVPLGGAGASAAHLRAMLHVVRGVAFAEAKEHSGQNKDTEALEAFQEAAQQEPNDARVQYYLGYGFQKAGQFAAAQAAYGRASRLDTAGAVRAAAVEGARAAQARRR